MTRECHKSDYGRGPPARLLASCGQRKFGNRKLGAPAQAAVVSPEGCCRGCWLGRKSGAPSQISGPTVVAGVHLGGGTMPRRVRGPFFRKRQIGERAFRPQIDRRRQPGFYGVALNWRASGNAPPSKNAGAASNRPGSAREVEGFRRGRLGSEADSCSVPSSLFSLEAFQACLWWTRAASSD